MSVLAGLDEGIKVLMSKYNSLKNELGEKGLKDLSEANIRKDFVDPLFKVLGWKIDDYHEYDAESYVRGAGYVDIALKIDGKPTVFIEAKRFGLIPSRSERGVQTTLSGQKIYADWTAEERQVLNYAGMSVGVKWAILTNFEKLRLFNARTGVTVLDIESVGQYPERLDDLALLSKRNVSTGNIDKLESRMELPDIDLDFLNLLNDLRLKLARNVYKNCPSLELDRIKHVVQRLLDRLIVIRYAEDRWILDDPDQLRTTYESWLKTRTYQKLGLTGLLKGIFAGFRELHDSAIFETDVETDEILDKIDSEVLGEVILRLYDQNFRKFTSDILGNTYENYLGHELYVDRSSLAGESLQLRQNRQLRKSGGIYYTRPYIVNYIMEKTLGVKLSKLWAEVESLFKKGQYEQARRKFEEIRNIKVLDPACGSGSFLIKAFQMIKTYYEKYNESVKEANAMIAEQVMDLRRSGKNKEAWASQIQIPALSDYEKDILYNNIYGVDLDPQAAEIASVNLVLQALHKGERLPLILERNIRIGNSLLSPDDANLAEYFDNADKELPFQWTKEFPDVFEQGGFDVVIGNPPHGAALTKTERQFFAANYKIARGYRNTASLFIERGATLLKEGGYLGFVIPKSLTYSEKWSAAREFLKDDLSLLEVADVSKAFPKVLLEQVVVIAAKSKKPQQTYVGTRLYFDEPVVSNTVPIEIATSLDALPVHIGANEISIFRKIEAKAQKMGTISHTMRGLPIQSKVKEEGGPNRLPLVRGDDIKPYFVSRPRTFIEKAEVDSENSKVVELSKPKIISQRIVAHVLKPCDHIIIMATLDRGGSLLSVDTVENTFVTDNHFDLRYVLAHLNSKLVAWYAYTFVFNKAVRTMDLDDYYIAKLPIARADDASLKSILESVEALLVETGRFFTRWPSFESYLNKVPRIFSEPFRHVYNHVPMKDKQVNVESLTKGSIRNIEALTNKDELVINIRYLDEDGDENTLEFLRMRVSDPLYLAFLKESLNMAKVPKSLGNLLERILELPIPRFKPNEEENIQQIHDLMKEYKRDVNSLKTHVASIRANLAKIDSEIYKLYGLNEDEITLIETQMSDGIYAEKGLLA